MNLFYSSLSILKWGFRRRRVAIYSRGILVTRVLLLKTRWWVRKITKIGIIVAKWVRRGWQRWSVSEIVVTGTNIRSESCVGVLWKTLSVKRKVIRVSCGGRGH